MTTITVNVQNQEDAELLKNFIQKTEFKEEVEMYEEADEYSAEDIAEWDKRIAAYEKDPSTARSVDEFMKEMKQKYGV